MSLEIIHADSKKEQQKFIDLEWKLNRSVPNWISPLRIERKKILSASKNPFFQHARMQLFLALKDNTPCGRIAAIINENHNAFHNEQVGFWGFFQCINDQQVADALFQKAAVWIRSQGMVRMYGPLNPSTNDEAGLLIDGFDSPPYVLMPHNPEYYTKLVDKAGNKKAMDLYAWHVNAAMAKESITDKMLRVSEKIKKKYDLRLSNFRVKNLEHDIRIIQEIYNNAWSDNWGFVPLTDAEIDHIAQSLKQFAREELLLVAYMNEEPIGFSITLPNINAVLAKIPNGRLFPSGIIKLITGIPKIKSVRVLILGVKKKYQFMGLGSIFYIETIRRALDMGIVEGEMSWILENNLTMNRAIEAVGSKIYKTYRIYSYDL